MNRSINISISRIQLSDADRRKCGQNHIDAREPIRQDLNIRLDPGYLELTSYAICQATLENILSNFSLFRKPNNLFLDQNITVKFVLIMKVRKSVTIRAQKGFCFFDPQMTRSLCISATGLRSLIPVLGTP